MLDSRILVNLKRCTGCWTCSLACKVGNGLEDADFRCLVRTLGSGEGIDRPAGTWPDLHESWMPVWLETCTKCPERMKEGEKPYCVHNCPNGALSFGEDVEAGIAQLKSEGFRIWNAAPWDSRKDGIVYASK
jgi:molybdopterin-containing oxidoreductase family iron-sulfur binding subunit